MSQAMNEMFKKDLPNLHKWCEAYAERTGVNVYAGNPPIALIQEWTMNELDKLTEVVKVMSDKLIKALDKIELLTKEPKQDESKQDESKPKRQKSV